MPQETETSDRELAFYGLRYSGNKLYLKYGWEDLEEGGVTILPDGTRVVTFGSRHPTEPSTIVVAFDRNVYDGYELFCELIKP